MAGNVCVKFANAIVVGTCPSNVPCFNSEDPNKSECYVVNGYNVHGGTDVLAHANNTLLARRNLNVLFGHLADQANRCSYELVRIHASGELESNEELLMWYKMAYKFPDKKFWVYTKRVDIVRNVINMDIAKPSNLTILLSLWGNKPQLDAWELYLNGHVNLFAVDADEQVKELQSLSYAADLEGDFHFGTCSNSMNKEITCEVCGKCYKHSNHTIITEPKH